MENCRPLTGRRYRTLRASIPLSCRRWHVHRVPEYPPARVPLDGVYLYLLQSTATTEHCIANPPSCICDSILFEYGRCVVGINRMGQCGGCHRKYIAKRRGSDHKVRRLHSARSSTSIVKGSGAVGGRAAWNQRQSPAGRGCWIQRGAPKCLVPVAGRNTHSRSVDTNQWGRRRHASRSQPADSVFQGPFEAWEALHHVPRGDATYVRDDVIQYLRSHIGLIDGFGIGFPQLVHSYEAYRALLARLSKFLFPWTAPYFSDHMLLHAQFYNGGRGLVFSAGDDQAPYLLTSIPSIRRLGCTCQSRSCISETMISVKNPEQIWSRFPV